MKNNLERNTLLSFQGPININVLSFFGNYIKILLKDDYKTINKIFKIFIELVQNISYYSAEVREVSSSSTVGIGEFVLKEYETYYMFITGNLVNKKDGMKLNDHCKQINSLNLEELRILKREKRQQSEKMDVGAHIGLIQVAIFSLNEHEFSITEIDENNSYFTLSIKIDKE